VSRCLFVSSDGHAGGTPPEAVALLAIEGIPARRDPELPTA